MAVSILQAGGVISVPTDTLYGLAASALDEPAVERIYRIKARPPRMALPLLLAESSEMERYAAHIPDVARRLAERFFPGPLTLVLRGSGVVSPAVTAGLDTIALRVPDHWLPRAIVRELGAPITGTSANRSGMPGATTAQAVRAQLGGDVDYVVDGGQSPEGSASTVLDVSGPSPVILREGALRRRDLEEVCGKQVEIRSDASSVLSL